MLADVLLAEEGASLPYREMFEQAGNTVARAMRFVLDREIVVAAQLVTEVKPSSIIQGLPLCRLPFPATWFEYAGHDRPGALSPGTVVPHRVGLLCQAEPDAPSEISVHVFWQAGKKDRVEHCPVALLADMTADGRIARDPFLEIQKRDASTEGLKQALTATGHIHHHRVAASPRELNAALALSNRIFVMRSRYFAPLAAEIIKQRGNTTLTWLLRQSRADAESEASLLLGILMLLNTRNGTNREPADLARINTGRLKRGKRPLLDHWTVTLRLSRGPSRGLARSGVPAHEIRAHLVRGHFKIRKSGIYWWSPHLRGDTALGAVHRKYQVKM